MRIGAEASAVVGGTPLVMLDRMADGLGGQVCAKLEYFNPGGSVKDRIGVAMIDAAEKAGQITKEKVLEAHAAIKTKPENVVRSLLQKTTGRPFYNLNIDAGSMWARRLIDRMTASEVSEPAEAAE